MCVHTKNPILLPNFNNFNVVKSEKLCVHTKNTVMSISRNKYFNQLIKAKNNGFAKVVAGIRRFIYLTLFLQSIF